ncbi:unnamed protein product [Amoebophrya sp. A120]|nr:unnamed protein product [Amoebophrya sp. A120]|eukprot:GSA120T00011167001.1
MATRNFEEDHDMVADEDDDRDLNFSLMAQPHPELSRKPPSDEDFFPQTVTWEEEIEGRITEFAVTVMHKKLLVVITQCGKIGSWIQATVDEEPCITDPAFIPDTTYETTVLFGARNEKTEYQRVYARRLMELLYKTQSDYQSLLLGIAMKTASPVTFKACMKSIESRFCPDTDPS